jgi:NADH-quinone oxidoreductase subunit F
MNRAASVRHAEFGKGREGDIELLSEVIEIIQGRTFCPLGDSAAGLVRSMIKHFKNEFEEHISGKSKCKNKNSQ